MEIMSPLLENAVDSLKVGLEYFLEGAKESSGKHTILTIFHSIELLLKEALYRFNPFLSTRI